MIARCLRSLSPLLRGEVGVRGASANSNVSDSRRDPLTPTLSP
jgi:hypothetical protein